MSILYYAYRTIKGFMPNKICNKQEIKEEKIGLRLKHSLIPKEFIEKFPVWDSHLYNTKIYI